MSWTFLRSKSSRAIRAGLDRLAEADVVGDEEVDPGQSQGLLQRLQLVGVDPDAGPERRLEQVRVGRGHAVPLQGVQVGREQLRRVESPARDLLPGFGRDRLGIDLLLPEHLERLALGVVIEAGHTHEGRVVADSRRTTSSTKYCRCRTRTIIPASGAPVIGLPRGSSAPGSTGFHFRGQRILFLGRLGPRSQVNRKAV